MRTKVPKVQEISSNNWTVRYPITKIYCYWVRMKRNIYDTFFFQIKFSPMQCCQTPTMDIWWLFLKFFTVNIIFGLGFKSKIICKNNKWMMKIKDNWITVPKWGLMVQSKIPQIPQNLFGRSAQLGQKFGSSKLLFELRCLCGFRPSVRKKTF